MEASSHPSGCPFSQGFAPASPEQLNDPFSLMADARATTPVFFSERHQVWVVTRHSDITAILKDAETYSSEIVLAPTAPPAPQAIEMLGMMPQACMAIEAGPDRHASLRKPFATYFSPRRLEAWEDRINQIADELIDGFIHDGKADFVTSFGDQLPARVIAEMVGLPTEDLDRVAPWAKAFIQVVNAQDATPDEQVGAAGALLEFGGYVGQMLQARASDPGDDLVTQMLAAHGADPDGFTMPDLVKTVMAIVPAGYQTTKTQLCMSMKTLLEHPEQLAELRADPSLIPNAVEEMIRFEGGLQHWRRLTTRDVEIAGVAVPAGSILLLHLGSGARDEAVFDAPDSFDIHRKGARNHLVFSQGIHACAGSALARMELRISFTKLIERLPGLRLTEGQSISYEATLLDRILTGLQIEWDAA